PTGRLRWRGWLRPESRRGGTGSASGIAREAPSGDTVTRGVREPGARPHRRTTSVIVFHIALTAADDYLTRREAHRRDHIERLQGLRANGILIGGGPSADLRTADLFYRLQQPAQLKFAIEEDPYWTGGVWTCAWLPDAPCYCVTRWSFSSDSARAT